MVKDLIKDRLKQEIESELDKQGDIGPNQYYRATITKAFEYLGIDRGTWGYKQGDLVYVRYNRGLNLMSISGEFDGLHGFAVRVGLDALQDFTEVDTR